MILVDTSVWIEYLRKKEIALSNTLKSYLKRTKFMPLVRFLVSSFKGVKDERERAIIESLWLNLPKLNEENMFIMSA